MRIQSPLSNLREVLAQAKSSASSYEPTLKNNEAATRAVLIDPVLRALGWDTANASMIEVEKTLNQTRADYALYDNGGNVKIIVEAKKLCESLSQHDVKLVNYAYTFKLDSIFLTDGLIWLHYTDFQPAHFAPTKILNIRQDDLSDIAAYLVQQLDAAKFWPEEQTVDSMSRQLAQLQSDVATLQQSLLAEPVRAPLTPKDEPTEPKSPSPNGSSNWVKLDQVAYTANLKPQRIRLPDGTEHSATTWKQVLIEACKYAMKHNPAIPVPFADRAGRRVNLFSSAPLPNDISQISVTYNGSTVYIYANYDARNCISNALYVLKQVPVEQLSVEPAIVCS